MEILCFDVSARRSKEEGGGGGGGGGLSHPPSVEYNFRTGKSGERGRLDGDCGRYAYAVFEAEDMAVISCKIKNWDVGRGWKA